MMPLRGKVVAKPLSLPKFFVMKSQQGISSYPRVISSPKGIKKAFTAFEGINPSRDNSLVGFSKWKAAHRITQKKDI